MKASKRTEKILLRCSPEFLELCEILRKNGTESIADVIHVSVAKGARDYWGMPLEKLYLCDIVADVSTNKKRKEREKINPNLTIKAAPNHKKGSLQDLLPGAKKTGLKALLDKQKMHDKIDAAVKRSKELEFCEVCGWGDTSKLIEIPGRGTFTLCHRCNTKEKFEKNAVKFNKTGLLTKHLTVIEKKPAPASKPVKEYRWNKEGCCVNATVVFSVRKKKGVVPYIEMEIAEYKGKWDYAINRVFPNGGGGRACWKEECKHKTREACIIAGIKEIKEWLQNHYNDSENKTAVNICKKQLSEFENSLKKSNNVTL